MRGLPVNVQYPIVHHKIKVFMLLKKGPLLFCIAQNLKTKINSSDGHFQIKRYCDFILFILGSY